MSAASSNGDPPLSRYSSEDPERPDRPRAASPPGPEPNAVPPSEEVTHLRLAAHYSTLVLASMVGTLIRLGLDALASDDGMVVYPILWSQGIGSSIMGISLAWKNDISGIYPPLYTFLTTGLAGSITTFSSWILEGYLAFANFSNYNRNGLHDAVDGLAYSFSTLAVALACVRFGSHISSLPPPFLHKLRPSHSFPSSEKSSSTSATHKRHGTPLVDLLTVLSASLAYLIALLLYFLAPKGWRHRATFPILLSPPGAAFRYFLSRYNTRLPYKDRFPLGTFLANMIGTLIIAGAFAAQRLPSVQGRGVRCNTLWAIQQGFCGCLTTVSTFAVELGSIREKKWKWVYCAVSIVLGHVFVLAIEGGVGWSEGYKSVCEG